MREECIDYGREREGSAYRENGGMLPEAHEEFAHGKVEPDRKNNENKWRDAEGDIGMKPESENETGKGKIKKTFGSDTSKEKIEREGEYGWHHDGTKTDAREIDAPVGDCEKKCCDQCNRTFAPELPGNEIDAEDGKCAEDCRPEFQCGNIRAKEMNCKRLQIDKESFAPVVVRIEPLKRMCFECMNSVDSVHGFVWVESGRKRIDVPPPNDECANQKSDEHYREMLSRKVSVCLDHINFVFVRVV